MELFDQARVRARVKVGDSWARVGASCSSMGRVELVWLELARSYANCA